MMKKAQKPLVDQEARDRAVGDLDTSLCVEAGAGTGKTTLLVGRFLSIVRSGRADATQIVAITFTEKAAGEMRVRLRKEITELLAGEAVAPDERAKLAAARNELERAPISTIHAFTASILREHPLEAGIDPRFGQMDELESSLFLDESWNAYLTLISEPHDGMLKRFLSLGGTMTNLKDLAYLLYYSRGERSIEGIFGACGDHEEHEQDGSDRIKLAAFRDAVRERAAKLASLSGNHCRNVEDRGYIEICRFLADVQPVDVLREDELEDFLLALAMPKAKGNKGNWDPSGACTEQKEIAVELAELQDGYRKIFTDVLRDRLFEWFEGFVNHVEERKSHEGVLDFDDLLLKTRELLRDGGALGALRRRYRFILVDEFQDTDPLQAEIIFLLSGSGDYSGDPRPEPGKLFIVGDPKQSIYRFRKADIEIYEEVKERLAGEGAHLKITQNFRSVPGVIGWINTTFSKIIQKPEQGKYQPAYEPIHPTRESSGVPVALLDFTGGEETPNAETLRRAEGRAIARLVRLIISEKLQVRDTVTKQMRAAGLGDIAVIYPGTTGIDHYEEPFREEAIPYIVEGGKLYYTRQEIRDIAAAVWAIEDPWDPLALTAVLRSAVFGFSDEELFLFVRAGGRLNYLEPELPSGEAFDDLEKAFGILAGLHRSRNERGPADTIVCLLDATKYLELCALRPHGDQSVLNIRKAVRTARSFERKLHSHREFARWFRDQDMLGTAEGESPLVEDGENAVRLLTIHKSKGLQFPVVILANLVQTRRRHQRALLERGRRLEFSLGAWIKTSGFDELAELEKLREEAEVRRLLYVAATRAGDLLVIPRTPKKGNYFSLLEEHLEGAERVGGLSGEAPEKRGEGIHAHSLARLDESALPPYSGRPRPISTAGAPKAGDVEKALAGRNAWLEKRQRLIDTASAGPVVVTPSGAKVPALSGSRETGAGDGRALLFGTAFHRLMESVDLGGSGDIDRAAETIAVELGIGELANELGSLARNILSSEPMTAASSATRAYREVPFSVQLDGGRLEGMIDLFFEQDGVWTAVDYKTDDIAAGRVDERFAAYRSQGVLYAHALRRLGFDVSGGVVFIFARAGESRILEVSDSIDVEAETLIESAISGGE